MKNAVLAAQLNRLEERERILDLRKREIVLRNQLRDLLGIEIPDSLVLISAPQPLAISVDSAVVMAVSRDTRIADAREEALVARRRLAENGWEYFPDMTVSARLNVDRSSIGAQLSSTQPDTRKTWALDLVGTHTFEAPDSTTQSIHPSMPSPDPSLRYTASIILTLPLLKGGQRIGEHKVWAARYEQARLSVIQRTRDKERAVRNAWAEYHAGLEQLAIQRERIEIARERYSLAETEYELGRIQGVEFDQLRAGLFDAQDRYFGQQFRSLEAEEALRRELRFLE